MFCKPSYCEGLSGGLPANEIVMTPLALSVCELKNAVFLVAEFT